MKAPAPSPAAPTPAARSRTAAAQRFPPLVVAALVNIVLLVMGIAMGIAGLRATNDLAAPASVPAAAPPGDTRASSEDPPPLTPVLDPAPKEPRPVEQIAEATPTVGSAVRANPVPPAASATVLLVRQAGSSCQGSGACTPAAAQGL